MKIVQFPFYLFINVGCFLQVKMDALGLVCESHRSTELLTSQEMGLIRHFLPPNLNSQSPGVRQQTVSLLKKVRSQANDGVGLPGCLSTPLMTPVLCSCSAGWRTAASCCRGDSSKNESRRSAPKTSTSCISTRCTAQTASLCLIIWTEVNKVLILEIYLITGVSMLDVWDAAGGFASWSLFLQVPHVPQPAESAGSALRLHSW